MRSWSQLRTLLALASAASVCFADAQERPIRVEVDLVPLYVTVVDKRGAPVAGLKEDNLRVWEDDVEQRISHFSVDDAPYTIGLVLDRSGSMMQVIDDVFMAAFHTFEASKPEDEAFVIVFNERIELVQEFTSDRKTLRRALHKVRANGQTALYDAVYTALVHIRKARHEKKALLVVTDGADNSSETTFKELLELAGESAATIYIVGFFGDMMRFGSLLRDSPSADKLTRLAEATGGRAYFPENMQQCRQACLDTAAELRHQYTLGYYPANRQKDGTWRKIRVELVGLPPDKLRDVSLRTREGYYAAKQ